MRKLTSPSLLHSPRTMCDDAEVGEKVTKRTTRRGRFLLRAIAKDCKLVLGKRVLPAIDKDTLDFWFRSVCLLRGLDKTEWEPYLKDNKPYLRKIKGFNKVSI